MTDNPRQDLEREAREAAERWYPPGAGRLGGKLYAGKPAKEGFRERSSFQHGYIAAATARDKENAQLRTSFMLTGANFDSAVKEIEELRRQVDGWKWIHNNNLEGLMILHDRQDLTQAAGVRIGDNISQAVPFLVAEIDRLRAKLAAVPVEEIAKATNFLRIKAITEYGKGIASAIDRWLAGLGK